MKCQKRDPGPFPRNGNRVSLIQVAIEHERDRSRDFDSACVRQKVKRIPRRRISSERWNPRSGKFAGTPDSWTPRISTRFLTPLKKSRKMPVFWTPKKSKKSRFFGGQKKCNFAHFFDLSKSWAKPHQEFGVRLFGTHFLHFLGGPENGPPR